MAKNFISEDDIEQALLQKLQHLHGFDVLDCHTANPDDLNDGSGRTDKRDVILAERVQAACERLNPHIPTPVIAEVVVTLMERRAALAPLKANQALDQLIRDGVPVTFDDANGVKQHAVVRLIDFNTPANNRYLAVAQLWIKSLGQTPKAAYRRPDVLLYVNGLPLVFIELKNSNVKLRSAFDDNLTNYLHDIPQLFHCNAFCILSNALETRVGSFTAGWEHFFHWLRVADEKEAVNRPQIAAQGTSLEYAIAGLCERSRLLDYVENFVIYHKDATKIIAQNHQFLGVNSAYQRFLQRAAHDGKLGVFWHTQGSGKSFSMIFYVRKIFRKVSGNFSFVVVTDRQDLDGQIYRNFLNTGTVQKADAAQPSNAEEMRKFLGQNKKVMFTLIQKFRYDKGKTYPRLFDPKDGREVIVMVDEAHRTQYKSLAENMRAGLQGAHFLAFTGTPLLGKERKTSAWFGGYVSEYNFQQAMDDNATVPLFYEKRVPKVLIQNEDLSEEFCELLEEENLDAAQQDKLERKFATELEVIKRDDRLDTIAQDIVYHFPQRGYLGKGMVITVDKFTAVTMYDKVQQHWKAELKNLRGRISATTNEVEKARLKKRLVWMKSVEMAVVISDPDIKPHMARLEQLDANGHDIEHNFKDPEHPLQLVFVCAMWLTGFDAPTVSTLYLDKPMKGHTLMQTIARANRVAAYRIQGYSGKPVEKQYGEIVDYYNVFRNMKQALKDYAQGDTGETVPVQEKAELLRLLDDAVAQTLGFCRECDIDLNAVLDKCDTFKNIGKFNAFANTLLGNEAWRKAFNVYDNTVSALYEACKPEVYQQAPRLDIAAIQYLRGVVDSLVEGVDIEAVSQRIAELLDESVVVDETDAFRQREYKAEYRIIQKGRVWDLSKIDFDKLRQDFGTAQYKNIEIADMRAFIEAKLHSMMAQNSTRVAFAARLQAIIERYNAGSSSTDNYFDDLVKFTQAMQAEDERHVREGLSEDELELYDLLKKDKLTQAEEQRVKLAAKDLLIRLLQEHPKVLVQDWWKDSQTQLAVKNAIEAVLDKDLPDSYDRVTFKTKCDNVFELVLDFAAHRRKWAA